MLDRWCRCLLIQVTRFFLHLPFSLHRKCKETETPYTENVHIAPVGDFGTKDLFQRQWRQVQHLANTFWDRWKKQYLCLLQTRRKWQSEHPNVEPGSIVLLKDRKNQKK